MLGGPCQRRASPQLPVPSPPQLLPEAGGSSAQDSVQVMEAVRQMDDTLFGEPREGLPHDGGLRGFQPLPAARHMRSGGVGESPTPCAVQQQLLQLLLLLVMALG